MASLPLRNAVGALGHSHIPVAPHRPLGRYLVEGGVVTPDQLVWGLEAQLRLSAPLGEILVAEGWATETDIQTALSAQFGIDHADLAALPPDRFLCARRCGEAWLGDGLIPWRTLSDGTVLIATPRPDRFDRLRPALERIFGRVTPVLVKRTELETAIGLHFGTGFARAASLRTPACLSCRNWHWSRRLPLPLGIGLICLGVLVAPIATLSMLTCLAIITMLMFAALKASALYVQLTSHTSLTAPGVPPSAQPNAPLPRVSVLVPLYREREIAGALIRRLSRLSYPKALLDVVLVLEAKDDVTRTAIRDTHLPPWIRVIEVPEHGPLTTKPRAMNYALDFCKGDIIGIWDAEDSPAFDQIEQVAQRFAEAPDDVVCLQGILDYYNPRTNWLSRCFTIEYATWFRVILPGIARMKLVVPLGGTTLFFRRKALEDLGGWDAHNVTEDADLGMRLCRAGYRTEMINTVTYEEANCRPWPWVKQRSRWLKGFLVTYLVHMRDPVQLARDLGGWRFLSFQAFFLGTLGQFLLAPVLWSYWLFLLELPHPLQESGFSSLVPTAIALFLLIEGLGWIAGCVAVSQSDRRFLMPFIPTTLLYFPLGTFAALKAVGELLVAPYFWDKTEHGIAKED